MSGGAGVHAAALWALTHHGERTPVRFVCELRGHVLAEVQRTPHADIVKLWGVVSSEASNYRRIGHSSYSTFFAHGLGSLRRGMAWIVACPCGRGMVDEGNLNAALHQQQSGKPIPMTVG